MSAGSSAPKIEALPLRHELTVYLKQRSNTHELPLGKRLIIGRSRKSDIVIPDDTVSRSHAAITIDRGRILVEELGSNNGSELVRCDEGEALELRPGRPIVVEAGDVLRLGSVPCLIQLAQESRRSTMGDGLTVPPAQTEGTLIREPAMKSLYELAGRAAQSEISVLVVGETGAGKEHVASEIHRRSNRASAPFMQLNCAALSESLLESELFGHERGAFTGATNRRAGVFESARGGTLFLDEMGEMPLATQAKLLRVLEERSIRRLGSSLSIPVDVRFVAATNRNLEEEVQAGRFRQDLYFRICGLVLKVPPLRERPAEIEPLARHFLQSFCLEMGIALPIITDGALEVLRKHDWPGNVRQLKNTMERAPLLSGGAPIRPEHLPGGDQIDGAQSAWEEGFTKITATPSRRPRRIGRESDTAPIRKLLDDGEESLPPGAVVPERSEPTSSEVTDLRLRHGNSSHRNDREDKERIIAALDACAGNQTRAAKLLGVSRRTLINRIESLGVPRPRKS